MPRCSICAGPLYQGDPVWKGGNNAQPVNNGRCCDRCNTDIVIPARTARHQAGKPARRHLPPLQPRTAERQPTLADLLLASSNPLSRLISERCKLNSKLFSAKRYVIDDDGARRLGEFVRTVPERVALYQDFAQPPFEHMWIEYKMIPFWDAANPGIPCGPDRNTGFLFNGHRVYCASASQDTDTFASWFYVAYDLFSDFPLHEQQEISELLRTTRIGIDDILWSTSCQRLDDNLKRSLRARHRLFFLPGLESYKKSFRLDQGLYYGSSGDLRNILAILLLLNQPGGPVILTNRPAGIGGVGKKRKTFTTHSTITLHLDQDRWPRQVPRPAPYSRSPVPMHDVAAFWRHIPKLPPRCGDHCPWLADDRRDPGLRYRCSLCHRLKTRVKEHHRGNSTVGVVTSEYEVTR